jgi:oxygen-independent coproporphyrinogen-3 oxidase
MAEHLYVHVPFCDGKCHYCGFYSVMAVPHLTRLYPRLPGRELARVLDEHPEVSGNAVKTVYWGGGTPALLGSDGLTALRDGILKVTPLDDVEEWTVELNPASAGRDLLRTLRTIGVNRISIGVQSFDDGTLRAVGRRHTAQEALEAVRLAQQEGFANTGIDLIAGLPGVGDDDWRQTLDQALGLNLKHLSIYALSLEPGTRLARDVEAGLSLPGEESQLDALAQAEERLTAAGFTRYEISNYALPGHECRHNLGIWRGNDYVGLGPSAATRLGRARWTNSEDVSEYIDAFARLGPPPRAAEQLSEADDATERAVTALRLSEGLDPAEAARRFPALSGLSGRWARQLEKLGALGIVRLEGRRWRLTPRGREVCDAAIRELL